MTFSSPWLFSPSVQPLCLSTREAMSRKPKRSATGRSRNSGEAEETMSSSLRRARYQAFMSPRCSSQKRVSSASMSGTRARKR